MVSEYKKTGKRIINFQTDLSTDNYLSVLSLHQLLQLKIYDKLHNKTMSVALFDCCLHHNK
jgi:hypothetical protein